MASYGILTQFAKEKKSMMFFFFEKKKKKKINLLTLLITHSLFLFDTVLKNHLPILLNDRTRFLFKLNFISCRMFAPTKSIYCDRII